MAKTYKASVLAKWFINHVDRDAGDDITHLKLQKLLYYAQAWHLANFGKPLFDEGMRAWTHGPVVLSVWHTYKDAGWNPLPPEVAPNIDSETASYLEAVFTHYGGFTAKKLEELTHAELPWKEARGNLPLEAKCDVLISQKTMQAFYRARLAKTS